jgi:transposase
MDNAKIHHGEEIVELIESFGVSFSMRYMYCPLLIMMNLSGIHVEYLLPYSPDLNLIEEAFLKVKHWLRHHNKYYQTTEGDGVLYDMWEVLDIITPDDVEGYFFHVGYF